MPMPQVSKLIKEAEVLTFVFEPQRRVSTGPLKSALKTGDKLRRKDSVKQIADFRSEKEKALKEKGTVMYGVRLWTGICIRRCHWDSRCCCG
jgi:hypothetical protein